MSYFLILAVRALGAMLKPGSVALRSPLRVATAPQEMVRLRGVGEGLVGVNLPRESLIQRRHVDKQLGDRTRLLCQSRAHIKLKPEIDAFEDPRHDTSTLFSSECKKIK